MVHNVDKSFIDSEVMDMRAYPSNYLSKVIIRAGELLDKKNFSVILNFEPFSLINFLSGMGWQYNTKMIDENNFQIYFTH